MAGVAGSNVISDDGWHRLNGQSRKTTEDRGVVQNNTAHRRAARGGIDTRALRSDYTHLTGKNPLRWQVRLFRELLKEPTLTEIDIPTGLGKTAVMALWLIALAWGTDVPRRLVYVVDRRAVVDQATTFAMTLRENLDKQEAAHLRDGLGLKKQNSLTISTLRGQHVDDREWLDDPAAPAIIVGTIDMIGSRLLFEGYGVSRKMRPYHAGMLGADTLIVLDEAHLSPVFETLIRRLSDRTRDFGGWDAKSTQHIPTLKLISLSATGRNTDEKAFTLEGDLKAPPGKRRDLDDEFVVRRLKARKRIKRVTVSPDQLIEQLAHHAWRLSENGKLPIRCVVFSQSREVALSVRGRLRELAARDGKHPETELLVGARRVRERTRVAQWLEAMGFLEGKALDRSVSAFLFATSAGEVGVDIDADHMVCDLVQWERMVQRLGRVNRRGEGDAQVVVLVCPSSSRKALEEPFQHLKRLPDGSSNGSPEALWMLKRRAFGDSVLSAAIKAATTPRPQYPETTCALVEAWSMTSLSNHTGRPEVSPWLRGWVDEPPQTTVIWRTYLPVRHSGDLATKSEIEEFFEAAPPHLSEQLQSEVLHVTTWLRERCALLLKERKGPDVVGVVLSRSGEYLDKFELADFAVREDKSRARRLELKFQKLANAVLVLNVRVQGLREGLLDSSSREDCKTADSCVEWFEPIGQVGNADNRAANAPFRVRPIAGCDKRNFDSQWQERYRFTVERDSDGAEVGWLLVEKLRGDSSTESDRSISRNYQLLAEHQSETESKMRDLARRVGLPHFLTEALAMAARLHDEGKKAPRWQIAFNALKGGAPYAKTKGPINLAALGSYRHEFGSLRYVEEDPEFRRLPEHLQDLVLHLVAAHHGQARPTIVTAGCEDGPPSAHEERARQVALRFMRLQARWGAWGLAWLETLLRAADQQASKENDVQQAPVRPI